MRWVVIVMAFAGGFFGGLGSNESGASGGTGAGGACATLVCMTGFSLECPKQEPAQGPSGGAKFLRP